MNLRLACLLLAMMSGTAKADSTLLLPFVDTQGMVSRALTDTDVEQTLGKSTTATVRPEGWTTRYPQYTPTGRQAQGVQVRTGGELDLAYPARGLTFTIDREDRPLKDRPIRWMSIAAPAAGRTPQGLYIGQPQSEVLAIARRHYTLLHERLDAGAGTLEVVDAGGHSRNRLWLVLQDGLLQQMQFDLKPPPTSLQRWVPAVLLMVAVGFVAWAIARWRDRINIPIPVTSARTTILVGKLLVWVGVIIGLASLAGFVVTTFLLKEGDNPYGGLGGVLIANYATTGLLLAFILVLVGRRIVRSA